MGLTTNAVKRLWTIKIAALLFLIIGCAVKQMPATERPTLVIPSSPTADRPVSTNISPDEDHPSDLPNLSLRLSQTPGVDTSSPQATTPPLHTRTPGPLPVAKPLLELAPVLLIHQGALWRTDVQGRGAEPITDNAFYCCQDDLWLRILLYPPQVSPDGRWIVVPGSQEPESSGRGTWLLDLSGALQSGPKGFRNHRQIDNRQLFAPWSPGGSGQIAYVANDTLYVQDVINSQEPQALFNHQGMLDVAAWSPDGHHLATITVTQVDAPLQPGEVWVVSVAGGGTQSLGSFTVPATEYVPAQVLQWSPQSDRLVCNLFSEGATVFAPDKGTSIILNGIYHALWSPDDEHLLTARPPGIVSPADGTLHPISVQETTIFDRAWAPGGKRVAYVTFHDSNPGDETAGPGIGEIYIVDVANMTAELIGQMESRSSGHTIRWSPDGQYLLIDDFGNDTPILRFRADGAEHAEILFEDSFLVDVIPWLDQ